MTNCPVMQNIEVLLNQILHMVNFRRFWCRSLKVPLPKPSPSPICASMNDSFITWLSKPYDNINHDSIMRIPLYYLVEKSLISFHLIWCFISGTQYVRLVELRQVVCHESSRDSIRVEMSWVAITDHTKQNLHKKNFWLIIQKKIIIKNVWLTKTKQNYFAKLIRRSKLAFFRRPKLFAKLIKRSKRPWGLDLVRSVVRLG